MADYIYLLQNRLTPAQRNTVEAVREVARTHGMPVFLVGGAARDLTSGTPVRDLDFAVQGDAAALVEELTAKGAKVTGTHPVLHSSYLLFPGGVRVELGPTQTVAYPKPNQPEAHPAAILDDLRRRDFTANAMAISLNEGSYGLLLDPLNGVADIENRELRLVSNYGFIEQPALALRVARLTARLGWTLEERTQARYETAKEEGYVRDLSPYDGGYELEEIFYEEDPLSALEHLAEEGFAETLYPAWTSEKADRDALERVRDLMGQLEPLGIHIDPAPVLFPLLTAKLTPAEVADLKSRFARPGFVEHIDSLDGRSKELAGQITARGASAPSDTWKIVFAAEPEVVLWLGYSSRSGAVQAKLKAFLNEWPQMRQRVPYALMQEMRITPDLPGYDQLLEDLFFALIDGKLDTVEATRAFLEPYSPPAPVVQASPRRRPAKATRSRSKKAVAAVSDAADDDVDDDAAAEDSEDPTANAKPTGLSPSAVEKPASVVPVSKPAKSSKLAKPVVVPAPLTSAEGQGVAAVPLADAAGKLTGVKEKASVPKSAAPSAPPAKSPAPTKAGTPIKSAAPAKPSPAPVVVTASADITKPGKAKTTPEGKAAPSGLTKSTPPGPPAKKAAPVAAFAKSTGAKKAAVPATVAKSVPVPAKKQAVKVAPANSTKPVKTAPTTLLKQSAKGQPAKSVAKKLAPPPARKGVPAKAATKTATPKKAVKVAAKGRR